MLGWVAMFFAVQVCRGQQLPLNHNIVPNSPAVTEFGRFTNVPVGRYTGTPEISVPLDVLQFGDLKVPISINYHGGGILVEQVSTSLGIGWSLNAGGAVSWNVRKEHDLSVLNRKVMTKEEIDAGIYLPNLHDAISPSVDTEPDIFSYNFLGFSGQILMDRDGKFYDIRGKEDLAFTRDGYGLKAIDLFGNEYSFMDEERAQVKNKPLSGSFSNPTVLSQSGPENVSTATTALYLTKITSADKKQWIEFSYSDEQYTIDSRVYGSIYFDPIDIKWKESAGSTVRHVNGGTVYSMTIPGGTFGKTQTTHFSKRISKIRSSNGEYFLFQYAAQPRKDLLGSYALRGISHYSAGNELLKDWQFEQGYFESTVKFGAGTANDESQNFRLKLLAVTEIAGITGGGTVKKVHRFSYYGDDPSEHQMPYRTSMHGADHWGYLNSETTFDESRKINNIFPNLSDLSSLDRETIDRYGNLGSAVTYDELPGKMRFPQGSNKEVNAEYAVTYSLKSITYPTGGRSIFLYEPHDYSYAGSQRQAVTRSGGLRIREIRNYSSDSVYTYQRYSYLHDYGKPSSYSSGSIINVPNHITQTVMAVNPNNGSGTGQRSLDVFLRMNSGSFTPRYSAGGDYIGYAEVIEESGPGKTFYEYYSIKDAPNSYFMLLYSHVGSRTSPYNLQYAYAPYPSLFNNSGSYFSPFLFQPSSSGYNGHIYVRGHLKARKIYNSANKMVQKEDLQYNFVPTRKIYGMMPFRFDQSYGGGVSVEQETDLGIYWHQLGKAELRSSTVTETFENGSFEKKEKYAYNSYGLLNEKVSFLSGGDSLVTKLRYPTDITTSVYPQMVQKRMINFPVESVLLRNGKLIKAQIQTYTMNGTAFLPKDTYSLGARGSATYQFFNGIARDSRMNKPENLISRYDANNNLQERTDASGVRSVYLWDKDKRLLAECRNIDYTTVKTVFPAIETDSFTVLDVDRLRSLLPTAMITTFRYSKFGTISRVTDFNGVETKYEYDELGRLRSQKDFNDDIIEQYIYKYQVD